MSPQCSQLMTRCQNLLSENKKHIVNSESLHAHHTLMCKIFLPQDMCNNLLSLMVVTLPLDETYTKWKMQVIY